MLPWLSTTLVHLLICPVVAELIAASRLPLQTQGRYIVDNQRKRVRLQCSNWYGAHMEMLVVNGLGQAELSGIAKRIVELGLNCIRLPYSLDLIYQNFTKVPNAEDVLKANPALQSLSPMAVFDETVRQLTDAGLMVILNNHVSKAMWCCGLTDGEGLWFTKDYTEEHFLKHLVFMTRRYKSNPLVAAFDLRNELRPSALGTPGWGSGNTTLDWSRAAETGARLVLKENPGMLVIVAGLQFSILLCSIPNNPIHKHPELRNHLAYTAHEYPWGNFHLFTKSLLDGCLATIVVWCCALCVVVLLSWLLEFLGVLAVGEFATCRARLVVRCCGQARGPVCCSGRTKVVWDFCKSYGAALLVTLASILGFIIAPMYIHSCTFNGWIIGIGSACVALILLWLSLVMWMRLAFIFFLRMATAGGGASGGNGYTVSELSLQGRRDSRGSARELVAAAPASVGSDGARELEATTPATVESECSHQPLRPWSAASRPAAKDVCKRALLSKRLFLAVVALLVCFLMLFIDLRYGGYDVFAAELDDRWGFLLNDDGGVPVWVGEFGNADDEDSLYWEYLMRYMRERDVDWAYWSLNGEKRPHEPESYGLLSGDMQTVMHPWKMADLRGLMEVGASLDQVLAA